ncbi:hypothetical protein PI124_g22450, partial [Phytophthora idaei]
MPRWSSMLLPTLALAPSQVHSSSANQMDFAACLIQHSPEYLCCECTETTKVLYTKYNHPSGGDYESYYIDGWNKQRQVNFPQQELQCANTNSSLATASQDSTVFWTYPANVRINNAPFPVGANCYSLMLCDGSVDSDLKATCVSTSTSTTPRFTTYTETPLVVIYLLYLAFFVVLGGWMDGLQELLAEDQPVRERDEQEAHCYPADAVKSSCGQCYWSSHGRSCRMQIKASEGSYRRLSNSYLGTFVFGCVVVASLAFSSSLTPTTTDASIPRSSMHRRTTRSCSSSFGSLRPSGSWSSCRCKTASSTSSVSACHST